MFNAQMFHQNYEDFDQEIINEIIQMFSEDYQIALVKMQESINQNDALALSQIAHKYKGTVSSMFDNELREAVQKLEYFGKNGSMEGANEILQSIKDQSQLLVKELKKLVI